MCIYIYISTCVKVKVSEHIACARYGVSSYHGYARALLINAEQLV